MTSFRFKYSRAYMARLLFGPAMLLMLTASYAATWSEGLRWPQLAMVAVFAVFIITDLMETPRRLRADSSGIYIRKMIGKETFRASEIQSVTRLENCNFKLQKLWIGYYLYVDGRAVDSTNITDPDPSKILIVTLRTKGFSTFSHAISCPTGKEALAIAEIFP